MFPANSAHFPDTYQNLRKLAELNPRLGKPPFPFKGEAHAFHTTASHLAASSHSRRRHGGPAAGTTVRHERCLSRASYIVAHGLPVHPEGSYFV